MDDTLIAATRLADRARFDGRRPTAADWSVRDKQRSVPSASPGSAVDPGARVSPVHPQTRGAAAVAGWGALTPLLLLAASLTASGCVVSDRDVSHDPHFRVGYRPGEVYELAQPVALRRLDANYFELVPPGEGRAYGKPAGTLPAGTRIRIVALRHFVAVAPINWEVAVVTTAELADRPAWEVALNAVSGVRWVNGDCGTKAGVYTPDPQWLVLVESPEDDAPE